MMKETDIRPEHLQEEQERLFMADVKRMMDRSSEFRASNCPACGSDAYSDKYRKFEMNFTVCSKCGTVFANPRPTPSIVQDYYLNSENYKFWAKHIFPITEKTRREKIFVPRVNKVIELCQRFKIERGGILMEVGPGFGTFCEEIRDRDYFSKIVAIEPTPDLAGLLRQKKFEVIEKFIEDVDLSDSADAVVAFEVIEHMLEPARFMRIIHNLLKPGGIVYLTCPNAEGFDTLTLGEHAPALDVEHLTLFTPSSLSLLMQKNGFEVLAVETPGVLDADIVRRRLMKDETLKKNNPFIKHLLVDHWDKYADKLQAFLQENKLSGNLLIFGRKQSTVANGV